MRPCNMLWGRSKIVIPATGRIARVLLIPTLITLLLLRVFEFRWYCRSYFTSESPGTSAAPFQRTSRNG